MLCVSSLSVSSPCDSILRLSKYSTTSAFPASETMKSSSLLSNSLAKLDCSINGFMFCQYMNSCNHLHVMFSREHNVSQHHTKIRKCAPLATAHRKLYFSHFWKTSSKWFNCNVYNTLLKCFTVKCLQRHISEKSRKLECVTQNLQCDRGHRSGSIRQINRFHVVLQFLIEHKQSRNHNYLYHKAIGVLIQS